MLPHRLLPLTLLVFYLFGCSRPGKDIHYIPFDRADVGPVTAGSIEEKAVYKWLDAPEKIRAGLWQIYGDCETKSVFDPNAVRFKLQFNAGVLLVDSNGVVTQNGYTCRANVPLLEAMLRGLREPEGRERIHSLLRGAVGPSGWYAGHLTDLESGGRRFRWTGKATKVLEESGGLPVLELDIYERAFSAGRGRVGVITQRGERAQKERSIVIEVFDPARLSPIEPKLENTPIDDKNPQPPYRAGGEPIERIEFPNELPQGLHKTPRSRTVDQDELVFLAAAPPSSGVSASFYVWHPRSGSIQALPQLWFVGEMFDMGYQWITQVRRDPKTKRLIGTGIRLWDFELDESGVRLRRVFLNPGD